MQRKTPFHHRKYTQLLNVLVLNFLAAPFLKDGLLSLIPSALLLTTIILVIRTFYTRQRTYLIYIIIAGLAFCLDVSLRLGWVDLLEMKPWFLLFSQLIIAAYLGVAVWLMVQDVFQSQRVTEDTVRGGICIYLLIGFLWALSYTIVATLDANAFSEAFLSDSSYARAVYLSFTTLTTLGYGDILPMSEIAQVLTNMEAIIGQLYPAVFIATLVSDYLTQRSNQEE